MSDIAQRAKVSRMAVSHVLMGTGKGYIRVSEQTAQRIRKIADELGYTPNRAAQQLAGKRSGVLGILANDWMHPMELRILSWMQQLADQRGLQVLAAQANRSVEPVKKYIADYASRGIDGLIFVALDNDALWPHLRNIFEAIPRVVSVFGRPEFAQGFYVDTDPAEGVRLAAAHLRKQGRRRIVQVLEDADSLRSRLRMEAFEEVHREWGSDEDAGKLSLVIKADGEPDDPRYEHSIDELIHKRKADAIIAASDCSALGLIHALYRKKLRVPDDIAVVGWGNEMGIPFAMPSLTTVDFRFDQIIGAALDLLITLIEMPGEKTPRSIVIPPQLLVRHTA